MLTLSHQTRIGGDRYSSDDVLSHMPLSRHSPTAPNPLSTGYVESKREYPNRESWERHRQTITDLYISEKQPLRLIVETMKRKHGFDATERMYKQRFNQWAVHKNSRQKPVGIIKPKSPRARRPSVTKQSSPLKNTSLIELAPAMEDDTSSEMIPVPYFALHNISAPEPSRHLESILANIDSYYRSRFLGQREQFSHPDIGISNFNGLKINDDQSTDEGLLTIHDPGYAAISLAKTHQYKEAQFLLGAAYDKLNHLLRAQHPTLLPFLLELICEDSTTPEFNVSENFRSFAYQLCKVIKGANDPLTTILELLGRVDYKLDTCAMILSRIQDLLGEEFGASKWEARRPIKVYCRVLRHLGRYDEVEQILAPKVEKYDHLDTPTQSELLGFQYELAWLNARGHKNFDEANNLFMEILRRTGKDAHLTQVSHFRIKAWRGLGVLAAESSCYGRSEEYLKAALIESKRGFGRRDSNTIRISSELETSLRHLTRFAEADELKEEREAAFFDDQLTLHEIDEED